RAAAAREIAARPRGFTPGVGDDLARDGRVEARREERTRRDLGGRDELRDGEDGGCGGGPQVGPGHDRVGGAEIDADRLGHGDKDGSARDAFQLLSFRAVFAASSRGCPPRPSSRACAPASAAPSPTPPGAPSLRQAASPTHAPSATGSSGSPTSPTSTPATPTTPSTSTGRRRSAGPSPWCSTSMAAASAFSPRTRTG